MKEAAQKKIEAISKLSVVHCMAGSLLPMPGHAQGRG